MRTFMTNLADFLISNGLLPQAQGLTDAEITMVTAHVPCPIPAAYHAFLHTFGGSDTSRWCGGDDLGIAGVMAAHDVHQHMIHDGPMDWLGDPMVIPIMQYAGYTLYYLRADMGDDPPVLSVVLGDAPPPIAPTTEDSAFSRWVQDYALASIPNPTRHKTSRALLEQAWEVEAILAHTVQYRRFRDDVYRNATSHGIVPTPQAFMHTWAAIFCQTDLYHAMRARNMPIPFGWAYPPAEAADTHE
ncbi:hypothetical protein Haur_2081 [Herpetosiphon aurantiacus DSM 785]|uniref:Knr4/Smi1-like domain-containing protein n=1 Tax=Herpetosiphon aurantiacus (strain ATCC 23779 / DSM 785 / 114-95) TaxID=316274 RepID=A9AW71_HERA2|nr:hypothetical protein Haur_2081 [Herpetosiphon aurantiacus DSM 785]